MQIDITNLCNLTCRHCYHPHHKNNNSLSLQQWFNVIDQYEDLLIKLSLKPHLIICGGEPLTSPFLFPILKYIKERKQSFHVSILTNGTLLSKIDLGKFKNLDRVDFQVSLDGPNQEIHDSFRGMGNFEKALLGIKKLKASNFNVSLQATLTLKNSELIDQFFSLASKLKVDAMNFTRLVGVGFGESLAENEEHSISPLELKNTFEKIIIHSARTGIKTDTEIPLMNLLHPTLGKKYSFAEGIVIDYQGNLLASSRSRVKLGSVLDKSLDELFFSESKKEFLNDKKFECSGCKHYKYCGGDINVSFATYGDFFKKDPGCWINIESA